ncbi:Thiolase-like protein [Venustampulla echinocandica]|uniref:Thiolase-like protein n=1 Tax=Venustampulla echinocandica TaxID=2656787 RepID=A0A370U1P3_9HELO|nr:Thiolase-like protein [Venustampulla echinocandica]RDL41700.1 Thiolase-like protein [Venustampulla echinocandica]
MEKVSGSETSVYTGCFTADYMMLASKDPERMSKYTATGVAATMLANRISWFFNLKGTSVTMDSACSSSMVALDSACQGLWNNTTSMALVAGCNLIFSPEMCIGLSNMSFLSPDSRSYSFDHRANGYSRGEGFGVLVVKRLADAVRDNDTIRAVIRSTGSNSDGYTPGVSQPSKTAQAALIRATYKRAGLSLRDTRFFEAHGTGTPVGDPLEAEAIGEAFQDSREPGEPLYIGAVKSNIGHLEGCAGIAGIIKTIMVLEKGLIPPNTNFEKLNPDIDAEFLGLEFPTKAVPWPTNGLRRASVNSFGFGGTNSHVVLDDAYNFLRLRNITANHCTVANPPSADDLLNGGSILTNDMSELPSLDVLATESVSKLLPKILVLSAPNAKCLQRLATTYSQHFENDLGLSQKGPTYLANLAYTLDSRRSALPWKSFYLVDSCKKLNKLGELVSKPVQVTVKPKLGFVFTGQGAQSYSMGRELLSLPVFKTSLMRAEEYLRQVGCEWFLLDELLKSKEESKINNPELSQPICTAIQVALVDLLKSFGVFSAAVVGHSSGEIAAAYSIGAISCEAAWKIAFHRGRYAAEIAQNSSSKGRMMSVGLSEVEIQPYLDDIKIESNHYGLTVSCVNSPSNVTISGDEIYIDILQERLQREKIFARKLLVNVAYHSAQMKEVADKYQTSLGRIEPGDFVSRDTIMVSSVTGEPILASELCCPEYWVQNMVSPVRFSAALGRVCLQTPKPLNRKVDGSHRNTIMVQDLLEIGPHSALQGPIRDILQWRNRSANVKYFSALIRNRSAIETTFEALGSLYCRGYPVDMRSVNQPTQKRSSLPAVLTDLPEYPFDHTKSYWHESKISRGLRFRSHGYNPLLGTPVSDWNPLEGRWRHVLSITDLPWVEDHMINGSILYPAAGMCAMAIEAAKQTAEDQAIIGYEIRDAVFHTALNIPFSGGLDVEFHLRPLRDASEKTNTWAEFRVYMCQEESWVETCRGEIQVIYKAGETEIDRGRESKQELQSLQEIHHNAATTCHNIIDAEQMYKGLHDLGYHYGPTFRPIVQLQYSESGEALGDVALNHPILEETGRTAEGSCVIHPTTFDGILQLSLAALQGGGLQTGVTRIPTRIGRLWISDTGLNASSADVASAYANIASKGTRGTKSSLSALSKADKQLLMRVEDFETTTIPSSNSDAQHQSMSSQLCYNVELKPNVELMTQQSINQYCGSVDFPDRDPEEYFEDLRRIKAKYISRALADLGTNLHEVSTPHIQQYVAWMQLQQGISPQDEGAVFSLSSPQTPLEDFCIETGQTDKQMELFVRTGQNLTRVLRGEVDALDLFFADGLMRSYYQHVNARATGFKKFGKYLDLLAHKNPGMKFLEIGAGTGATTEVILDILTPGKEKGISSTPRYGQYDFTDISSSFFPPAQEIFGQSELNYMVLDVEEDPAAQNIEPGTYDIIVASHVLHATRSLTKTLENIRKLLKPGGKLFLVEVTKPDILGVGFTFGLFSGWWLSTESYRIHSPCITEEKWDELLRGNGFTGTDHIFRDYESDICHEWSILISTAASPDPNPPMAPRVIVVADTESETQQEVARMIQESNSNSTISSLNDAASAPDLGEASLIFLPELEQPLIHNLNPENFSTLMEILKSAAKVLWVSATTPESAMITGLARVLRTERNNLIITTLHLDAKKDGQNKAQEHAANIITVFNDALLRLDGESYETEYVEKDGMLQTPRIIEAKAMDMEVLARSSESQFKILEFGHAPPLKLSIRTPGLLDTLEFIDDDKYATPLGQNEVEVRVKAAGVNFRDCLIALGRLEVGDFGAECSGIVTRIGSNCNRIKVGARVCGCYPNTYQTFARAPEDCVVAISDNISFVEAASLPTTFATVYHGLHELARMEKGESILIHAASGGTGQAAIQLALHFGAVVFVTVGTEEKKQLLIDLYKIPEEHILYSRDNSFAKGIKRLTQGRGVDVVLNSLSGEGLKASWECIAPFGRFIEIGKKDIQSHSHLPMSPFAENVTFSAIDLATMAQQRPALIKKVLIPIIELVELGKLSPANPLQSFGLGDIEKAFRHMQGGKNSGKMVIEFSDDAKIPAVLKTKPTYSFQDDATYLISGGLGGLGRSISRWMVGRGARHLLLLSRSGPTSPAAQAFLAEMRDLGVQVETPVCDVAYKPSLAFVLEKYRQVMPPIKGCIQGAMVLKDAVFETMTYNDWKTCVNPKVQGSWNLESLLPQGLDFFILLSSVCGIIGMGGQANYAAANTYLDALAEYRLNRGEKAVSLDLGPLLSEGLLAENDALRERFYRTGTLNLVSQEVLLALLDYHCDPGLPLLTQTNCQVVTGLKSPADLLAQGTEEPPWMQRPMLNHLHQLKGAGNSVSTTATGQQSVDLAASFSSTGSLAEAGVLVTGELSKRLAKTLSIPVEDFDLSRPIHTYGLDSLVAVELRNWFEKELKADIAIFEILGGATLSGLGQSAAAKSQFRPQAWSVTD